MFAARQLSVTLTVELRELSDREAIVLLDIENRQRRDLSANERGRSYARWLAGGVFESQDELASALQTSSSQVSRLLKLAKLPSVIVEAFANPVDICEVWGLELHSACENTETRPRLLARARALRLRESGLGAREVVDHLLAGSSKALRQRDREESVAGEGGELCFALNIRMQRSPC